MCYYVLCNDVVVYIRTQRFSVTPSVNPAGQNRTEKRSAGGTPAAPRHQGRTAPRRRVCTPAGGEAQGPTDPTADLGRERERAVLVREGCLAPTCAGGRGFGWEGGRMHRMGRGSLAGFLG